MHTAYGLYHVVYSPFGQGYFFKTPEAYLDPNETLWNDPAAKYGEKTFRAMKYMRPGAVWAMDHALFEEYARAFPKTGKKFYMISNIDRLKIHHEVATYYGERARATTERHLLGFARYGSNDLARMTIRTSSTKARLQSNIYATKEDAIAAIQAMEEARTRGVKTKLFLD